MEKYTGREVIFCRRYVDDTFCLFSLTMRMMPYLRLLWRIRKTTKYVFLDVLLAIVTPIFLLHQFFVRRLIRDYLLIIFFFGFTPFSYKMGLINTLVDMAYKN